MKGYIYFIWNSKLIVITIQVKKSSLFINNNGDYSEVSKLPPNPIFATYKCSSHVVVKKITSYANEFLKNGVKLDSIFSYTVNKEIQSSEYYIYTTKKAIKEKLKISSQCSPRSFVKMKKYMTYNYYDNAGRLLLSKVYRNLELQKEIKIYNDYTISQDRKKNTTTISTNDTTTNYPFIASFFRIGKQGFNLTGRSFYYNGEERIWTLFYCSSGKISDKGKLSKTHKYHGILYNIRNNNKSEVYQNDKFISNNLQTWHRGQGFKKMIKIY
jgi:hypothetical protein